MDVWGDTPRDLAARKWKKKESRFKVMCERVFLGVEREKKT